MSHKFSLNVAFDLYSFGHGPHPADTLMPSSSYLFDVDSIIAHRLLGQNMSSDSIELAGSSVCCMWYPDLPTNGNLIGMPLNPDWTLIWVLKIRKYVKSLNGIEWWRSSEHPDSHFPGILWVDRIHSVPIIFTTSYYNTCHILVPLPFQ
jgi:hypothetical protein